ncbi:hypothetical protein K505DRAFT_411351 [Melanomma pulvis-pyrius CBS 109.77]|uniref:Uncharacterized protein n=1 Tax=Melanomma pulvis-pyrius CBS 109.77 TaxID=1314802 RepID=A0A6A6WU07_9PLEO|nr:hypothetical protein K505DRAFT_411351 [Melanomma pulvis-pyrius CBS 109.77]
MPLHTPSPHRFLAPHPSSTPQPTKPKPQSSLRHGFTAQTPKPAFSALQSADAQKTAPSKRFVITPVRSVPGRAGATRGREDEAWTQAQTQQTPRAKLARKLERGESIEEGSQSSPSGSPRYRDPDGGIAGPIEQGSSMSAGHQDGKHEEDEGDDDDDEEMLFTPRARNANANKRRRLSPVPSHSLPAVSISTHAQAQPPRTPAPASNTYRFLAPTPRTPQLFSNSNPAPTTTTTTSTATTPAPASTRPHFILPPQHFSPPKPSNPLPETFSPSRKGQKYVPDGLASTLQSWIVEAANTGYAAQTRDTVIWGREKEDGVKMRVRVTDIRSGGRERGAEGEVECYPGGFVLASGDAETRTSSITGDAVAMRVMLAGQGGARGAGGVRVRVGNVLGIRAPMWDVEVGGETWIVGVDWVVL